jgi:hypothetical protein
MDATGRMVLGTPFQGSTTMRSRQNTLIWMKDLIEHMNRCHEQLQWADRSSASFLTESLLVDLSECRRLCEQLQTSTPKGHETAYAAMA